jgi:hypothetical protein
MGAIMQSAANPIMPIPGLVDPVPVPRAVTPRADGRIDLIGLSRPQIASCSSKRGWTRKRPSCAPSRCSTGSTIAASPTLKAMTDIAKTDAPWLAERFVIGRPKSSRRSIPPTAPANGCCAPTTGRIMKWCSSPMPIAARCAFPARSAARSTAGSATPARCGWSAT